ncbi:S8 family peptidase [Andreprevotia chitinilytica]|uniref:S8 family peptidase n=1 Tax=Andreprevotia chitinilytica TaxID=396808 RepID=UPI001FE0F534|nr:S8 family serine peptidase [Andreprevotia chitinilytica]
MFSDYVPFDPMPEGGPHFGGRMRRRLLLRLPLGEVPDHLPTFSDCLRRMTSFADTIDGGVVDRLIRHHCGGARTCRLHSAARYAGSHLRVPMPARAYDDLEMLSGVARVLRLELQSDDGFEALVDALRQLASVEDVSPNYLCTLSLEVPQAAPDTLRDDAGWSTRRMIRTAEALGYEPGDEGVIVGLLDTGVAQQHRELAGKLRRGFDAVALDASAVGGDLRLIGPHHPDNEPDDDVGHGTGCAGIIGALGDSMPPGLAGQSTLLPVRVLGTAVGKNHKPVGIGSIADIDRGMKRLIDLGAKVINMSFGTPESMLGEHDPPPHTEVVNYGLARGCILVAASGNSGATERFFPAAHPGVIAVGAVDADGRLSHFSTRGEHVALCAPGERIETSGIVVVESGNAVGGSQDSAPVYQWATGTSFAAPFVTATAALLVARAARRALPLDPATARDVLIRSTRPFATTTDGAGNGVLDALAALRLLDDQLDTLLDEDDVTWEDVASPTPDEKGGRPNV